MNTMWKSGSEELHLRGPNLSQVPGLLPCFPSFRSFLIPDALCTRAGSTL